MKGTHTVIFENLRNPHTGEVVKMEIPNSLVYEGKFILAGELGKQAAKRDLERIKMNEL